MSETNKIMIIKTLAYLEELKNSEEMTKKENQLMVLNGYINTLNSLNKMLEEKSVLEEKLLERKKQVEILLDIVESYRNKEK